MIVENFVYIRAYEERNLSRAHELVKYIKANNHYLSRLL